MTFLSKSSISTPALGGDDDVSISDAERASRLETSDISDAFRCAKLAVWDGWLNPLEIIAFSDVNAMPPLGLARGQIETGIRWADNVYPPDRAQLAEFLEAAGTEGAPRAVEYRMIVGDGELLWVRHWILQHSRESAGGRERIRSLLMAIPEEKHLEWECLRVSERECTRIGQDLHDDLCQVLAGLTFLMRSTADRARKVDGGIGREIDEMTLQVNLLGARVRSMAHGLFPTQLHYATLRDALSALVADMKLRFSVDLELALPAVLPRQTSEQIIHVFRIVQEAVGNAVRHGQAQRVKIELTQTEQRLHVRIEDDGTGFPQPASRPEGIGIHTMQYRARVLGGTFTLKELQPRGIAAELSYPPNFTAKP